MHDSPSPVSLRSGALALVSALLLAGAVAPAAGAEEPDVPARAPAGGVAGGVAAAQEGPGELEVPETAAPPADDEVSVSAVVETADGPEVVSVEVPPSRVAAAYAALRARPGATAVAVDSPVSVLGWSDPEFGAQWGLAEMNLWDPLPDGTADGSGVQVAVVDTGVLATHEDLADRVRCDLGADFTGAATTPSGNGCTDPHGHGTHVAGTVAAIADNGLGVAGASAAEIIPVRVLGPSGWGEDADVAAGIIWAVDHGAEVVNLSLGGDASNPLLDAAVKYAVDRGVVIVAAAGNNRESGNRRHYPAATPGVFAVASTDSRGVSSWFSYSGPTNLISAPGSDIISTTIGTPRYGWKSGTSMAAPHVAGILARYVEAHPTATVAEIRTAVQTTAIDIEAKGRDDNTGYGLIDAFELLTGQPSPARTWVTAPGQPTRMAVVPRAGALDVTWQPPLFTGGAAIQGYGVSVHKGTAVTATSFVRNVLAGPAARRLTVPNLVNGQRYQLFLFAYHSNGELVGNAAFTPAVAPRTTPGAPGIGKPSAGNGSATVRWTAPARNGGAAITGYVVRAFAGTKLVTTVSVGAAARSAVVKGLRNGTKYTFAVAAKNVAGTGAASARSAAVTPRR
jgi:subtilisin family serine protease